MILKPIYEIIRKSREFRWTETQRQPLLIWKMLLELLTHWYQLTWTLKYKLECLYSRGFATWPLGTETQQGSKPYPAGFGTKGFHWFETRYRKVHLHTLCASIKYSHKQKINQLYLNSNSMFWSGKNWLLAKGNCLWPRSPNMEMVSAIQKMPLSVCTSQPAKLTGDQGWGL